MEEPLDTEVDATDKAWWHEPLAVFAKTSAWIAFPVVCALFVGRYLDERWGTAPWAFLGTTGFAFMISCFGIVRESRRYMRAIEENHENGKHTDHNER